MRVHCSNRTGGHFHHQRQLRRATRPSEGRRLKADQSSRDRPSYTRNTTRRWHMLLTHAHWKFGSTGSALQAASDIAHMLKTAPQMPLCMAQRGGNYFASDSTGVSIAPYRARDNRRREATQLREIDNRVNNDAFSSTPLASRFLGQFSGSLSVSFRHRSIDL